MSDDEVIRIYDEAYARWKGLSYEIDELRQKYLMERLVLQGK